MRILRNALAIAALGSVASAVHAQTYPLVEAGNGVYRAVITDESLPYGNWGAGFATAFTGPAHPITSSLARPGDILAVHPQCPTCGGWQDFGFLSVRSWTSQTDYLLGTNVNYITGADPGFTCVDVNASSLPSVSVMSGAVPGVHATWEFSHDSDAFAVERIVRVHGDDSIDSRIEMTLVVKNVGTQIQAIGLRDALPPRISTPLWLRTGYATFFHVTRPPDEVLEPYDAFEAEWFAPSFHMLELSMSITPSRGVWYYVGGVIGPILGLEPAPTPPTLFQATSLNAGGFVALGGAADKCFDWHPPVPARHVDGLDQEAMISYWGHDEPSAITLAPGEEARFTTYLVAYEEFPLLVDAGADMEIECVGSPTRTTVTGSASTLLPTVGMMHYEWSCDDPRVSFTDPTSAATTVDALDPGDYEVRFTAAVGAFQTSDTMLLRVVDTAPPVIEALSVTPGSLWPPNHSLVPVRVALRAEDSCDPAPSIRLVSVLSNEPDDARRRGGDGSTDDDIQGADLGTDDREILLRAERSGRGPGRIYTLTYEASDASGNVTTRSIDVRVAHDRGSSTRPAPPRRRP